MKKTLKYPIIPICLVLSAMSLFAACEKKPKPLSPPVNVSIAVEGRIVTVTWDAVNNAQGYMIVLTSEGCSSGNRTIDTRAGTMMITGSDNTASNVKITGATSVKVTLMAAAGNPNRAMAKAVTAKVMSLGGAVAKTVYVDSDYSEVVRLTI